MSTTTATESGTWQVVDGKLYETPKSLFDQGYWVAKSNNVAYNENEVDRFVIGLIDEGAWFIGIWTDGGKTYVDDTVLVGDLIDAIQLARKYDQKAIWDIAHNTEIWV